MRQISSIIIYHYILLATLLLAGVSTMPRNRVPNFNVLINPCLISFLPVHFLGLHCSKSHMATGNVIEHSSSCDDSINPICANPSYKAEYQRNFPSSNLLCSSRPIAPVGPSPGSTSPLCREPAEVSFALICTCSFCSTFRMGTLNYFVPLNLNRVPDEVEYWWNIEARNHAPQITLPVLLCIPSRGRISAGLHM